MGVWTCKYVGRRKTCVFDYFIHAKERSNKTNSIVNNAGVALEQHQTGGGKRMHEVDEKTFDGTIKVNSKGVFLGCKYAIAQMLKQDIIAENGDRGWVINIASVAGWIGIPSASSYSASKHACIGITRVAAVEYGPDHIHVNAICPGYIETPMTETIRARDDRHEAVVAQHPWGRFGKPDEIAKAAVFLASDDASFMTGVPMPVDGGYLAR
jgi:NAD(P)-dependent dehydrogenase (short-subunit alcohol dehydrogenase family)